MKATVLGATGFVGSHLAAALRQGGHAVSTPPRDACLAGADLGVVFYCIGLTADFRTRVFDTVAAHVCKLHEVLQSCRFDLLVYLSSTRLYAGGAAAEEEQPLRFAPSDPDDLYNLSKAMGESLALHSGRPVRVARLSNVYGPDWASDNFLPGLIRAAVRDRKATLRSSPLSAKDYVSVHDVADLLIRIASGSEQRIYNVAGGRNVTAGELVRRLQELCGCDAEMHASAPAVVFPPISIARVQAEFGFRPRWVLDDLPGLVEQYRAFARSAA